MSQTQRISRNNTSIVNDGAVRTVVLHATPIVTVSVEGVLLNNGGWVTSTTCTRMNQVANEWGLGYAVGWSKGVMHARIHRTGEERPFAGETCFLSHTDLKGA